MLASTDYQHPYCVPWVGVGIKATHAHITKQCREKEQKTGVHLSGGVLCLEGTYSWFEALESWDGKRRTLEPWEEGSNVGRD